MDLLTSFQTAQHLFDHVLTRVPENDWDAPSRCADWTVRDVVGHIVWGQDMIVALARQEPFTDRTAAPGSDHPAAYLTGDPLPTWRAARDRAGAALTDEALAGPLPERMRARPDSTVASFLEILVFDTLTHSWDVGRALGIQVDPDDELVATAAATADRVVRRVPGFFGPELTPPDDADPLTALMAFAGRS